MRNKIFILEPGAWGTTLGVILSKKHKVYFWYGDKNLAEIVNEKRENSKLPGIKIPEDIEIVQSLTRKIERFDLIIIASPSFFFRKTVEKLKKIKNLPPILGLAKGIEKETCFFPSQIVEDILGKKAVYAHLSGPGFARKIIKGKKAQEVIASKDPGLLKKLRTIFKLPNIQISTITDLIGLEIAGALKNIISIGIGLIEAKNPIPIPQKTKRKLIRLGLKEMTMLGKKIGAEDKTFFGPAGLGDLILTASPDSRNWQFGCNLFKNHSEIRKLVKERKITVEGFESVFAAFKLAKKHKIKLPIISEIYSLIYKKAYPEKVIENLIKLTNERRRARVSALQARMSTGPWVKFRAARPIEKRWGV